MRRCPVIMAAAVLGLAVLTGPAAAAATSAPAAGSRVLSGTWGTAIEVPGSKPLNSHGHAAIVSVSCATAGNCSAGGYYADGAASHIPFDQAMVVSQAAGTWGTAQEVPGTAALNVGQSAQVNSVSCASPGNCSAGGYYTDAGGLFQAFVVTQIGGTWGTAIEVPGTASLDQATPGAQVTSVSCASAGNCSAGGFYTDAAGHQQAFIVNEGNGAWGTAQEVPGTASLNVGGFAEVNSVSCAPGGACSAGGLYATGNVDGVTTQQAFVVSETGGTWGRAKEVPGSGALNSGGFAAIYSVSCASAGNCSAGGAYTDSAPATQAFTVSETNGTWKTAKEVPGIAALNVRGLAQIGSLSCASAGNCSAGGFYLDASFDNQAFVVTETGGTWGTAEQVPGIASLNRAAPGDLTSSVSCGAVGDCGAGGYYTDASGLQQAFVVSETGGTWGTAIEVPGTAALNQGSPGGQTTSLSCPAAGDCGAGGFYTTSHPAQQSFVVSETGT